MFNDNTGLCELFFFFNIYFPMLLTVLLLSLAIKNVIFAGCGEKGTLLHCWRECKSVQPLQRTVFRFLKKLKIELPYDPTIILLGIYQRKL